jgi:hypothetical protein
VVIVDIAAVVLFESLRSRLLSLDGLWNARTALWSVLLLLDTLVAVGWYAWLTHSIASAATVQAAASEGATALAIEQADAARRPCVVVDRRVIDIIGERASSGEAAGFYLHNVGPGFAVNISFVDLPRPGTWQNFKELGALETGGVTRLPQVVEKLLRDSQGPYACLLIAESFGSRIRWVATVNVRDRNGEVSHAIVAPASSVEDARAFIGQHWAEIDAHHVTQLKEINNRGN